MRPIAVGLSCVGLVWLLATAIFYALASISDAVWNGVSDPLGLLFYAGIYFSIPLIGIGGLLLVLTTPR